MITAYSSYGSGLQSFWEWLKAVGSASLALGRFLVSLGWGLLQIASFIGRLLAV
jgi:hypothetical protein